MQKRFSWLPVFIRNCNPADELCDWNTGYGTLRCNPVNSCPGAAPGASDADRCYPNHVWSGTEVESSSFHRALELNSGSFYYNTNTCGNTGGNGKCGPYAFTVRCVLDLKTKAHYNKKTTGNISSLFAIAF